MAGDRKPVDELPASPGPLGSINLGTHPAHRARAKWCIRQENWRPCSDVGRVYCPGKCTHAEHHQGLAPLIDGRGAAPPRPTRSPPHRSRPHSRARPDPLAAAEGRGAAAIAKAFGVCRPTAYNWTHRFNERGPAGLEDRPRGGRPPTYTAEQRAEVIATARTDPKEPGQPFARWTLYRLMSFDSPNRQDRCERPVLSRLHSGPGAVHGPPDPILDRGATPGTPPVARPRCPPLRPRARRGPAEDRRGPLSSSGGQAGPAQAARPRHPLLRARLVPILGSGGADGPCPRRLPREASSAPPSRSSNDCARGRARRPVGRWPPRTPARRRAVGPCGRSGPPPRYSGA